MILNEEQKSAIIHNFRKILEEQNSAYAYKDELIRNYITVIIHEALKMQPSDTTTKKANAAHRITSVFLELLERQFPIDSTERPLELKTAQGYANQLAYELSGFLGYVVSTNGHVVDGDRLTIYYGAADEFVCGAHFSINAILG